MPEGNQQITDLHLDVHGVRVIVTTNDETCADYVASDFSYFRISRDQPMVDEPIRVQIFLREPPYNCIPPGKRASLRTKTASVYGVFGSRRYLDTLGRLLVIQDFAQEHAELYSLDRELLLDHAYLMIMSRLGERLDRQGLHRVHAMGVTLGGVAALCLMPMGGGKTTLTLSLLEHPHFSLLSDEAPLVDCNGIVHEFPIRLGVRQGLPLGIPESFLKPAARTRHGPKVLIDAAYFADRMGRAAQPGILFVGRRMTSSGTTLRRISRFRAARALWVNAILASGLPQLLEYTFRLHPLAALTQVRIHLSRALACYRLLRSSECYDLALGVDTTANAAAVSNFLSQRFLGESTDGQD